MLLVATIAGLFTVFSALTHRLPAQICKQLRYSHFPIMPHRVRRRFDSLLLPSVPTRKPLAPTVILSEAKNLL